MPTRHVVISGASIAGLSAAFWLRRTGWHVTVVERAPNFRGGGQNVDVRGVARDVLKRMGLFDAVKKQNTTETETVFVTSTGEVRARLPSGGANGATAELEILRGDFARTILDHLPDGVEFIYGDTICQITDGPEEVLVTTVNGRALHVDLVVIAEGVRSNTRDLVFKDLVHKKQLGVTMVFGTIPRTSTDDNRWRWFTTVGGRQVHLRPDNHGTTRAMLAYSPSDKLDGLNCKEALAKVRARYTGVGWEAPRILDAFESAEDIYMDELVQIRMRSWHRGRVALAGDAGWCITPMGGGGASLALTSGYILAASLASHEDDLDRALNLYEEWLRPLVEEMQKFPSWIVRLAYPQTRLGLTVREVVDKVVTSPLFKPLAKKLTQVAETAKPLPEIPV